MKLAPRKRGGRLCQAFACLVLVGGWAVFLLQKQRRDPSEAADGSVDVEPKPGHMPNWMGGHSQLEADMRRACDENRAFDLLWYGDSITESFREEVRGRPCTERCDGIAAVWESSFAQPGGFRAAAFGLSGDTTEHLLWRIMHGESPACPGARAVVLLIGTNDLGIAAYGAGPDRAADAVQAAAPKAAEGAKQVALLLRKLLPTADILMLGVLPRGLKDKGVSPPAINYNLPSMYTSPIWRINAELASFAQTQSHVYFQDCGGMFVNEDGDLDAALMPDALHPNAEGMRLLAQCVKAALPLKVRR